MIYTRGENDVCYERKFECHMTDWSIVVRTFLVRQLNRADK